jgi:hypothetical protein
MFLAWHEFSSREQLVQLLLPLLEKLFGSNLTMQLQVINQHLPAIQDSSTQTMSVMLL